MPAPSPANCHPFRVEPGALRLLVEVLGSVGRRMRGGSRAVEFCWGVAVEAVTSPFVEESGNLSAPRLVLASFASAAMASLHTSCSFRLAILSNCCSTG